MISDIARLKKKLIAESARYCHLRVIKSQVNGVEKALIDVRKAGEKIGDLTHTFLLPFSHTTPSTCNAATGPLTHTEGVESGRFTNFRGIALSSKFWVSFFFKNRFSGFRNSLFLS